MPAPGGATFKARSDGWKSCFRLWGTEASFSGDEKNHSRPGGARGSQAFSAGQQWQDQGNAFLAPEEHRRARRPHPPQSKGQQP